MLQLASQNFAGRRVLLIESDVDCIEEMTAAIHAAGGVVASCVTNGFAAISYVKLWKVDAVALHTQTLERIPFPLNDVMRSLGVDVAPLTSFDDWFDLDEEEEDVVFPARQHKIPLAA